MSGLYLLEDRARARSTIKRIAALAAEARRAAQTGTELVDDIENAIVGLTQTGERSRQVDALSALSEKFREQHLKRLKPLAKDDFNAFCEYVEPDEPPESAWHIWLTELLQKVECEPGNERFVLNCPPGHAKPLDVDTPVRMAGGHYKRLGDVEVGDWVTTVAGTASLVSAVHDQGYLDCLRIITEQGREIVAAPDHPFLIRERHGFRQSPLIWVEAKDLKPTDLLVTPKHHPRPDVETAGLDAFELAAYFGACGGRTYQRDRTKTRRYLNAFIFSQTKTRNAQVSQCLNRMGIEHTMWFGAVNKVWHIRLDTAAANAMSADYNLETLAVDRQIPRFVWRGGDAEVRRYIETVFAVAGHFPNRFLHPRLHLSFRGRAFAEDFQRLLAQFNVPATLDVRGRNAAKLVLDTRALQNFHNAGFVFKGKSVTRLAATMDRVKAQPAPQGDYVRLIEKAGKHHCRCLTVDGEESFTASDVIVHNSTYASRKFVAWRMGRRPRDKTIGGGHSQRFVENEFSKKIRNLVGSQAYHDIFPEVVIDSSTRAADQWALAGTGGQYVAKGAGQAIHGFRANFVCIDDPYAKIEAAESPTIRESVRTWFFGDVGSRLLPNAVVFVIMTRFHEDDLTGSIQEANKSLSPRNRYRIVSVPAICWNPDTDVMNRGLGEVLWDYYDLTHYQSFRATWSYQRFSLVFQQLTDATDDSSIASKFFYYKIAPHDTDEAIRQAREAGKTDASGRVTVDKREHYRRIIASVDTATKTTERSDYSVCQIWGETKDRKYYLLDQVRGKWELPDLTTEIEKIARRWSVDAILVEDKGNGTSYIQNRAGGNGKPRLAPSPVIAISVPSNQGKEFRFDEVTPLIEAGEVCVPQNATWIDAYVSEIGAFPEGSNDDQVDATSQALRYLKSKRRKLGSRKVATMG